MINLKTDSFIGRRTCQENVYALAASASAPAVFDGYLGMPFVHRNSCAELSHSHWDLPLTLGAKTKDENETLGLANLNASGKNHRQAHAGLVSMAMCEQTQAHGIGSSLLSQLINACDTHNQLSRLDAMIGVDNAPLLKVFENNEFEIDERFGTWASGPVRFYDVLFCVRLDLAFASTQALHRRQV